MSPRSLRSILSQKSPAELKFNVLFWLASTNRVSV
jgi:hypothetical protein